MTMHDEKLYKKALNLSLRLLLIRGYSSYLMHKKLISKNFPEDICNLVLEQLITWRYLDDRKFAENFVMYRKQKGLGRKKIYYELLQKGIESTLAEAILDKNFSQVDEDVILHKIAFKKIIILQKRYSIEDIRPRLFRFLLTRGFAPGIISSWINTNLSTILDNITNKL
jgi:regulatory protein